MRLIPHVGRVIEDCVLLGYNDGSLGNQFMALRGNVGISSSRVRIDGYLTLECEVITLYRNILERLPNDSSSYPRSIKSHAPASRRPATRIGVSLVRLCTLRLHNIAIRRRFSYMREGYVTHATPGTRTDTSVPFSRQVEHMFC